ncbi:MAG: hypothetical protein PHF63_02385 [Herbinix sp.]|nr:hypothetical protein [Herbinix sp.]
MKLKLSIIIFAFFIITALGACKKETELNEAKETITEEESALEEVAKAEDPTDITDATNETINANDAPSNEDHEIGTNLAPFLMETPPFHFYKSDNTIKKEIQPITLEMKSCEPNKIIDEDEWFINNNLSLDTFQVPNAFQNNNGNLPDNIAVNWNGLIITKSFFDDSYIYCTYGSDYSEGYILNIYDVKTFQLVYTYDFSAYRYSPEYIEEDYDFIQQKINWAVIKDDILYISHSHNTYANSSKQMNAYITAIDFTDQSIVWRTDALVCNSYNFVIIDDVIVCGYGFTDEPDYLYQVNIHTGEILEKLLLKTAPSYFIKKDNILYVRTYNADYAFDIIAK